MLVGYTFAPPPLIPPAAESAGAPLILYLALDGSVVSLTLHLLYPWGQSFQYPLITRLDGWAGVA